LESYFYLEHNPIHSHFFVVIWLPNLSW